jgi:PAS domain S-box-containing protein
MFRSSPDALIVVGPDGVIQVAGPATAAIFGYEPAEVEGQPVEMLLPEPVRTLHRVYRATYAAAPEGRPMGVGRELYGRHRDGSVFPVDVSLVPAVVDGRAYFGAFVRDATERRREQDVLRFVNEISRGVIAGEATPDLFLRTARAARALVGAAAAWISVRLGDEMVVAAADGAGADALDGARTPVGQSLAARVMATQETATIANMASEPFVLAEARAVGFEAGLYLPMHAEGGPVGSLVLARRRGEAPFGTAERGAAEIFVSAAAIVLALGTARRSLEEMRFTAEHERIARDLHDTVIQRLFGLGMRLQAAESRADGGLAETVRTTVDAIDGVIREIRETIFDLNRSDAIGGGSPRARLRQIVGEAAETLGFEPEVTIRGPIDSVLPNDLAAHLVAVVQEALSNVSRHASAARVEIVADVSDGWLTLHVLDDGTGIERSAPAGQGLVNMAARAEQLGGECVVTKGSPSGTVVRWRVPVRSAAS